MPKISIIVPVYNVQDYLDECVQSLLHQTMSDIEIILVNDGSTDQSGQMLEEYGKNDARVNVLHKENGGQSSARNLGISVAKGKYIMFVDSDDYIAEDACEVFFNAAERLEADIVTADTLNDKERLLSDCDFRAYPKENTVVSSEVFLKEKLKSGTYDIVPWLYFIKLEYFNKRNLLFPEGHFYEDQLYTMQLLCDKELRIAKIRYPFYFYRTQRPDSTTNYMSLKKGTDAGWICNEMRKYAKEHLKDYDNKMIMTILLISYYQFMSVWIRLRFCDRRKTWSLLDKKNLKEELSCVTEYKSLKKEVMLFLRCRCLVLFKRNLKKCLKRVKGWAFEFSKCYRSRL